MCLSGEKASRLSWNPDMRISSTTERLRTQTTVSSGRVVMPPALADEKASIIPPGLRFKWATFSSVETKLYLELERQSPTTGPDGVPTSLEIAALMLNREEQKMRSGARARARSVIQATGKATARVSRMIQRIRVLSLTGESEFLKSCRRSRSIGLGSCGYKARNRCPLRSRTSTRAATCLIARIEVIKFAYGRGKRLPSQFLGTVRGKRNMIDGLASMESSAAP